MTIALDFKRGCENLYFGLLSCDICILLVVINISEEREHISSTYMVKNGDNIVS